MKCYLFCVVALGLALSGCTTLYDTSGWLNDTPNLINKDTQVASTCGPFRRGSGLC